MGFAVVDDGPRIPAADREKVFDSGYSTAADGTGLGLAIVRQVAVDLRRRRVCCRPLTDHFVCGLLCGGVCAALTHFFGI